MPFPRPRQASRRPARFPQARQAHRADTATPRWATGGLRDQLNPEPNNPTLDPGGLSNGDSPLGLAGIDLTPTGVEASEADNLIWLLGAYVERKGGESRERYLDGCD